ncbi:polymer-forming cytoskeletal protein [Halosimplex salinum]|uniref:polymer-forming cytoskeletal protein n=1 Tax=Halosimplex salinum TaxID=1710538 RepID=UPI000F478754|nr:polymer-forming cytoskeletal protein [Halosimplex salinum]
MRRGAHREIGWREWRAQSNVIAVVLLAGLIVAGATVVVVAGSTAINEAQSESSYEAAEQSMQSLGSEIERVSQGKETANVELNALRDGSAKVDETAGEMTVSIVHQDSGATDSVTLTLGEIQYEQDQRTLAYQNGGLFEKTGNGSSVVSPPKVSYRAAGDGSSLTVPIVVVSGKNVDDRVTLRRTSVEDVLSRLDGNPKTAADDSVNPLTPGTEVRITIESEYYRAWGSAFRDQVGTDVDYDSDNERVSFTLEGPAKTGATISRAVFSSRGIGSHVAKSASTTCYDPTGTTSCSSGDVYLKSAEGGLTNCFTIEGDFVVEEFPDSKKIYGSSSCGGVNVEGETLLGERRSSSSAYSIENDVTFEGYTNIRDTVTFPNSGVTFEDDVRIDGKVKAFRGVTIEESLYVEPNPSSNELKIEDGTEIKGDLVVNGRVRIKGTVTVHGDIYVTDQVKVTGGAQLRDSSGNPKSSTEIHENLPESDVKDKMSDGLQDMVVSDQPEEVDITNEEPSVGDSASDISSGTLDCDPDGTSESCTLDDGTYKLNHLRLGQGDDLTLDTRDGAIKIYVEENVDIPKNAEINVIGNNDNRVAVFVEGAGTSTSLHMDGGSSTDPDSGGEVTTPSDKAAKFWVYLDPDDEVKIKEHAVFTGVIYGPGSGSDGDGTDVYLDKHATVRGGIVANLEHFTNDATIEYDMTLKNEAALTIGTSKKGRIAYLRTSARVVSVED